MTILLKTNGITTRYENCRQSFESVGGERTPPPPPFLPLGPRHRAASGRFPFLSPVVRDRPHERPHLFATSCLEVAHGHREHHHQRQSHPRAHLLQPSNRVVLEPQHVVDPGVDALHAAALGIGPHVSALRLHLKNVRVIDEWSAESGSSGSGSL